jgi:hypothetical protein
MSSSINLVTRNGYTGKKDESSRWKASVTATQLSTILNVGTRIDAEKIPEMFGPYVATGDITYLSDDAHAELKRIVKACQEQAPSASAARRYWPRKIASVLLHGE